MPIIDPLFYVAAVPAVIMTGISKGGVASGLGVLAVPVMSLVISPIQAAGIMLPILIAMDVVALVGYRSTWDGWNLKLLIPASTVGVLIGWATAHYVSDDGLRVIVGSVALAFVIWQSLKTRSAVPSHRPSTKTGAVLGAIGGFTSFYANAGGPPLQMWLLPQRLPKEIYAGTWVVLFAYVNLAKVIPFFLLGQFGGENISTSLLLFPLAVVSTWIGVKLTRVVPEKPFYVLAYATMLITGVWLTYDGVRGLLGL